MSKGLEALENIKYRCWSFEEEKFIGEKDLEIIENALQRLESIDNANPSEALECSDKTEDNIVERNVDCLLHNIENGHFIKCDVCDVNWHKGCMCCIEHLKNSEEINIIKQALLKAQEQEKVLEIIKECVMPLVNIDDECVWDNEGYEYLVPKKEDLILLKRYFE